MPSLHSVAYRPLEPWAYRSDMVPNTTPEVVSPESWELLWESPSERLDHLRPAADRALASRGLTAIQPGGTSPRPALDEVRHYAPAYTSLTSWDRVVKSRDSILWVPPIQTFAKLVRGEFVRVPEVLKNIKADEIRIAVPSQEILSPESTAAWRGTPAQRIETALLLGQIAANSKEALLKPSGLPAMNAATFSAEATRWSDQLERPADAARPFAEAIVTDEGLKLGREMASRPGVLPREAWEALLPALCIREASWHAARRALGLGPDAPSALNPIAIGKATFGIPATAKTIAECKAALEESLVLVGKLTAYRAEREISKRAIKLVVTGGRDYNFTEEDVRFLDSVSSQYEIKELVSGAARGADTAAEQWARSRGIPVRTFPADWSRGKGAGFERNREMARYADVLAAFPGGSGTAHMVETCRKDKMLVLESPSRRPQVNAPMDSELPVANPSIPLREWDPRAFIWFVRQLHYQCPLRNPSEDAVESSLMHALQNADRGVCMHFDEVLREIFGKIGPNIAGTEVSGALRVFSEWLKARLVRHTIDAVHSREIPGDPNLLIFKGRELDLIHFCPPEVKPTTISFHTRSELEANIQRAENQETFEVRGTADSSATYVATQVGIPFEFPTRAEALHTALSPSYQLPETGLEEGSENTSVAAFFKAIAGVTIDQWQRPDSAELGARDKGHVVRDIAINSYLDSIARRAGSQIGQPVTELPEIRKAGNKLLRFLESQTALACCGWAGNAPATSVVAEVAVNGLVPANHLNCIRKYVGEMMPERARASSAQKNPEDLVDALQGSAAALYNKIHGERRSGRTLVLPIETGNPYVLGRTAVLSPSAPEARAEVVSWVRSLRPFIGRVPVDAAPLKPTAQKIADGALAELGAQLVAGVSSIRENATKISEQASRKYGIASVLPLETMFEAFTALTTAAKQVQPGLQLGPESVQALGAALANSPANVALGKDLDGDATGFILFAKEALSWKTANDASSSLRRWHGIELSPAAVALIGNALKEREVLLEQSTVVASLQRALDKTASILKAVRSEYPMIEQTTPALAVLDQSRIARAKALLSYDQQSMQESALTTVFQIGLAAQKVADRKEIVAGLGRATTLNTWAEDAVKDLTALPSLAVPIVVGQDSSGKRSLGGLGGAYACFLTRFGITPGFSVEFDRTGNVQAPALAKWAASAAISLDSEGIVSGADREQLRSLASTRNMPPGTLPICHSTGRRDYQFWLNRLNDAPAKTHSNNPAINTEIEIG